jgi:hypothetical protein
MTVHDAVDWFAPDETTTLVVAPADIPLLESVWVSTITATEGVCCWNDHAG